MLASQSVLNVFRFLDRVINRIRRLTNRVFLHGHNISLECVVIGINRRDGSIIVQVLSSPVGTNLTKVLGVVAAFFFDDLNRLDQRWLLGKKTVVELPVVPFEGVVGNCWGSRDNNNFVCVAFGRCN